MVEQIIWRDLKASENHNYGELPASIGKESDLKETVSCPHHTVQFLIRGRKNRKRNKKKVGERKKNWV